MTKSNVKKEIKEWAIFAAILLTLYFTGLNTEVAAFAQRIVLASGIANPNVTADVPAKQKAEYDFTLDRLDGDKLNFETLKGKVVFVNFWATWCAPCIAEMPTVEELYKKYENNDDVVFVMINVEKKKDKVRRFIKRKGFSFPIYFPDESRVPKIYESRGIPTTFVIDKEGYISYKKIGMANYNAKSFNNFMEGLLNN